MKVKELLDKISDNNNINIINIHNIDLWDNDDIVANYDGKNSIGVNYFNYKIEDFHILGDTVNIFINQLVTDKLMVNICSYMDDDVREECHSEFDYDLTNEEWLEKYIGYCYCCLKDKDFLDIMQNEFSGVYDRLMEEI